MFVYRFLMIMPSWLAFVIPRNIAKFFVGETLDKTKLGLGPNGGFDGPAGVGAKLLGDGVDE